MINTNCSFSKFNDLVGIHKVIFDSLIDGKSLTESMLDVKSKYLQRYFGNDLKGLGDSAQEIADKLSDVASAMFLATKIVDESNSLEQVESKIDVSEAQTIINDMVSGWQAQMNANAGLVPVSNVETRTAEEEINDNKTGGDIEPTYEQDQFISSNIIAEPLNVKVTSMKTPTDLTFNYFKSATISKNKLTRTLFNDLFKASFIDLSNSKALPVKTGKEVDTNVKNYKSKLYSTLYPNEDLYVDGVTRPDFHEKLNNFEQYLSQMNSGNGPYVQDLFRWHITDAREMKQYHAFITLKHFDDMIKMYGSGFVKVRPNLVGNYSESLDEIKYVPANFARMRTSWSDDEIVNIAQETTAIFRTFIETTPVINLEGYRTGNFLKPDQVYFTLSKLKNKIDKSDVTGSIRTAMVDAIETYFKGTNKSLTKGDVKTLLSLYQRVYADPIQNKRWRKDEDLAGIIGNIEAIKENSLFMVYKAHYPGRHDINLLEVISATINKVDLMNYGEVGYDFATKEYKTTTLQTKLNDRQFNIIKVMGSQSLNATEQSMNQWKEDYGVEVDDQYVRFSTPNREVLYNASEGTFSTVEGDEFDFNTIDIPTNLMDLGIDTLASNYKEYKALLDAVAAITGQPLAAQNYEIAQIYNDNQGNSHIKDLLALAGNFAFTSHLKATRLQGLEDMSNADIQDALESAGVDVKKLWNSRSGYFNLDFHETAFAAMRNYADVLNEVYGTNIRSTTLNAQGNAVPTYTLSRMINDFGSVLKLARNSNNAFSMPLANNMFVQNTNNDLLKKVEVRTHLRDTKGNLASSAGLTDIERVSYDIFNDYIEQKINPDVLKRDPKFQPTNYADKASHAAIIINGDALITINGVEKRYRDFTAPEYKDYFFETQLSYYSNLWDTLKEDYRNLFESGELHRKFYASTKLLKLATQLSGEVALIDYNSLPDNYKGDVLDEEVRTYNELFKVNEDFLIKGVSDFSIEEANEILGNVNEKVLKGALAAAGINTIKTLFYEVDPATKKPVINRTLQYMLDNFGSKSAKFENDLKRNFLKSLEDIGFTLDTLADLTLNENPLMTRAAEHWNMAEFHDKALGRYKLYTGDLNKGFKMNPMLEQYLWEYNLNTQNFQNATVGTQLGHPAKVKRGKNDTDESYQASMLSARSIAMFKRMVIHQATFHPYNLNLVNGIPFYGKVAFIQDPTSDVFSPYGLNASVDVTDGSTYNLPLLTILQNNSLLDQSAGWTQKSIGGGLNNKYNSAELLKHAAHTITNERLNNENEDSKFSWMNLVKKGLDSPFAIEKVPVKVNISVDFNGQPIKLEDTFSDVAFFDPILKQYLSVQKIEPSANWMASNEYNVTYKDLVTGQILDPKAVNINSLFDLWTTLGGKNSISFTEGEYDVTSNLPENLKSYAPSNRSWEALAEYVNRVGVWNNNSAISTLIVDPNEQSPTDIKEAYHSRLMGNNSIAKEYTAKNSSPSQKTIIQPLKQSFIGQFTFSSGQKVGVQNENDTSVLLKGNTTPLRFASNISNMHTGIQLNSDHDFRDSSVTEPTQITNTLPFNGDTPEYADKAFKAIYMYIDNSLSKVLPDVDNLLSSDPAAKFRIYNLLANEIVRGLEGKDLTNMAGAIASTAKKELDRYKEDLKNLLQQDPENKTHSAALSKLETLSDEGFKIPFSDSNIYGSFATIVANFFTKNGIRRKLPGSAIVISPYAGFAGMRDVVDPVTGKSDVVNEAGYNAWKTRMIDSGQDPANFERTTITTANKDTVEMFDTLIDNQGNRVYLSNPEAYYKFKADPNEYTKLNTASRDLKPTMHKWKIEGNIGFTNYYDLPVSKLSFLNGKLDTEYKKLLALTGGKTQGMMNDSGLSQFEIENGGARTQNISDQIDKVVKYVKEHNDLVQASNLVSELGLMTFDNTVLNDRFYTELKLNGKVIKDVEFSEPVKRLLKNELTQAMNVIYNKKRAPMPIVALGIAGSLSKYNILTDWENPTVTINAAEHYANYVEEFPGKTVEQWYADVQPMVRVDELTTIPGEMMMPPIFKTRYGILASHTVSDINEPYFRRLLNAHALPEAVPHDFYVRSLNGEHLYVLLANSANHRALDLREVKVDSSSFKDKQGNVKTYKLDEDGNPQYELGYDKLYQSMIGGKMQNYVVVNDIDQLKKLKAISKGPNSSYKDIIPNFQAGVPVATMAIEIMKFDKDKYAGKFANSLKVINNLINSKNQLENAKDKITAKGQVLLDLYDKEWVDTQIGNITKSLFGDKLDEDQKIRATDKLGYLKEYAVALETYNDTQDPTQLDALYTQAAIFRNSENRANNSKIEKLTESLAKGENQVDEALRTMAQFLHNDVVARNERFAKEMYSSFRVQLNATAARIPGQHMQSYMGQTIVGFVHSEENLGFVSPFHMWITGEDFDIDKAYVSQYAVDENGKLIGWSNMFNYDTPANLLKSLELPIPDKKTRTFLDTVEGADAILDENDVLNITGYLNTKANFPAYVDSMKKLDNAERIGIVNGGTFDQVQALRNHINTYFLSEINERYPKEATLNVLVSAINGASNDIRNTNAVYSPISFGEAGEAANRSKKGEGFNRVSPFNPVDIAKATGNNMIGREVIGIAASGGLKTFSALSNGFKKIMDGPFPIKVMTKLYDYRIIDGKLTKTNERTAAGIAGINYTNSIDQFMDYYKSVLDQFNMPYTADDIAEVKIRVQNELRYRGDVALDLSAVLSAATDNAKELILARINAGPETAMFYMAGLMYGFDFETLSNLMTSNEAEAMITLASRNLYNGKRITLNSALKQLGNGMLEPRHYFDFKTMKAVVDQLKKNEDVHKSVFASFASDVPNKERIRALKNPYTYFEKFVKVTKGGIGGYKMVATNKIEGDYTAERYIAKKAMSDEDAALLDEVPSPEVTEEMGENGDDFIPEGYQDEMESGMDEIMGDFAEFATRRPKVDPIINADIAYNRYVAAAKRYIPSNLDTDILSDLAWFNEAKTDFEVLGKILGINQSIKVTDYDLYKYFKGITDFMSDKYEMPLTTLDDFDNFVSDDNFRAKVLNSYTGVGINVLSVLHESPHFFKMFTLAVKTDRVKDTFSAKNKLIRSLQKQVADEIGQGTLSVRMFGTISNYVNEVMIVNFLKSSDIAINLAAGDYDNTNSPINAAKTITLETMEGRQAFTNWFEKNVINDLKAGRLRDSNNEYYEQPIANIRENAFIQHLTIDTKKDPMIKKGYHFYKLRINMAANLTEDEKVLMDTITGSFASLRNYSYGGKNLLDLLYLYNLIVNKNKATGQSFNRLFDAVSESFDNDSVMTNFVKFESELDWNGVLLNKGEHYDIEDLVRKGVVSVVEVLPRDNGIEGQVLPTYVAMDKWDSTVNELVRTIYMKEDNDYYPLEPGEYTEKIINIHNGTENLKDMIVNNEMKVKLNRLNKLLENMTLTQLDC